MSLTFAGTLGSILNLSLVSKHITLGVHEGFIVHFTRTRGSLMLTLFFRDSEPTQYSSLP